MSGTITVPEVAHDTEEDEYVVSFPISPTAPTRGYPRPLVRCRASNQVG